MDSAKAQERLLTLAKNLKHEKGKKLKAGNNSAPISKGAKANSAKSSAAKQQNAAPVIPKPKETQTSAPQSPQKEADNPVKTTEPKNKAQMRLKAITDQKKSEKYAKMATGILAKKKGRPNPLVPPTGGFNVSQLPRIPKKQNKPVENGQTRHNNQRNDYTHPEALAYNQNDGYNQNWSDTVDFAEDYDDRATCNPNYSQNSCSPGPGYQSSSYSSAPRNSYPPAGYQQYPPNNYNPRNGYSQPPNHYPYPPGPRNILYPNNQPSSSYGPPPRNGYPMYHQSSYGNAARNGYSGPSYGSNRGRQYPPRRNKAPAPVKAPSAPEPASPKEPNITQQLQDVRTLVEPVEMMDCEIICPSFEMELQPPVSSDLHIVIDTNVVINELKLIANLKTKTLRGMKPKIIVPWQVLKELDYLKSDKYSGNLHLKARKGIRYILDELVNGFINGQPQMAASRDVDNFQVEVPDDHLVKCGLQLKSSGHNVILLSEDKNLVVKSMVCGLIAMNPPEVHSLLDDGNKTFSIFEMSPADDSSPPTIGMHRVMRLLRNFLSAILKRFWMYKHNNLWMLYSPGAEPWPLNILVDTVANTWAELVPDSNLPHPKTDVATILTFLGKLRNYKVTYADLERIGRACHSLASALATSFATEVASFDSSLAFLKCPKEIELPEETTYQKSCALLTVHHVHLFENTVVQFCYGAAQRFNVPFNYPKIPPNIEGLAARLKIEDLPRYREFVKNIGKAMNEISMAAGTVDASNSWVKSIYFSLKTCLADATNPMFFVDDVVEFCNDESFRQSFPNALQELQIICSFFETLRMAVDTNNVR
ncbi:PINc [Nesidiocoris tenuis]|uniref:PINc n=1 Tax=Nesidiocoris tenuis TaxID=355587 RepID=A0ABN7B1W7_9HEMI|nr:PINc [Nesidiocoris tenuis]